MAEKIVRNPDKAAETAKKTAARTTDAAKKTASKATETAKKAEPVKKAASAAQKATEPARNDSVKAARSKRALPYRIGAIVLWILALGFEVLAIMALLGNFTIRFTHNGNTNMWILLIGCIVLDMILAILAAQLWKKANRISPMSEKRGKFLFYLWNELGVIMACICFIPLIVLLLKNDKLDKKTKTIVTAIAAAALLITGLTSAEYHPMSEEKLDSAETAFEGVDVYWTQFGHVFHLDPDHCYHLKDKDYYVGTVTEAIDSGKTRICSYCESHASDEDWNTPQNVLDWITNKNAAAVDQEEGDDLNKAVESTELVLVP
ncbi:MAG: hypothetical protein IKP19_03035 [Oscillospiraceae bacterium]|nr:hypothetical protein [Oscillospiraceae bacterium]